MIDPHISGSYGNHEENYDERFESGIGDNGFGHGFGCSPMSGGFGLQEGSFDYRANRLYQSLEKKGQYAELDKAKRNEHYRAYLLENFDESEEDFF